MKAGQRTVRAVESEHVVASLVNVGDPVGFADLDGWWFVEAVQVVGDRVTLGIVPIGRGEATTRRLAADQLVRRGDPAAVHQPEEFIGMTVPEARVWAATLGWRMVGPGDVFWGGDTQDHARIRVWTGDSGTVVRASFF
jgi:hypothetical protein